MSEVLPLVNCSIMASPGQKKGACGHIMASFDKHSRCARCREKGQGDDPCVQNLQCDFCSVLTPEQVLKLSTPTYKLRKEKAKAKEVLVDPSSVVVLDAQPEQEPAVSVSSAPDLSLPVPQFKKDLQELDEKWATRMARLEALITLGHRSSPSVQNPTFSPVKVPVSHAAPAGALSQTPFFVSTSASSGPAGPAVGPDEPRDQDFSFADRQSPLQNLYPEAEPMFKHPAPVATVSSAAMSASSQAAFQQPSSGSGPVTFRDVNPQETFEEGELSDAEESPDLETSDPDRVLSEDQNYRETVRGVRAFMGWTHIPKAEPQVAANLGSQYSKSVFMRKNIQNGDSRDNPDLSTTRGVGDIARLQRRLLPHPNSLHIPKIPQVPLSEPVVPVSGTSLWPVNSSHGVHWCGQRGQVNGSVTGYKNPPVPRRLVDSSPYQRILPPGNPVPPSPLPGVGLDGKHAKIRTGTPTSLRLRRLPVRPTQRSSQAYSKSLGSPSTENNSAFTEQILPSENFHVSYRSSHCDRKTGDPRQTAHETYSVAPQETLESPRISGKGDPNSEVSPSVPAVVDPRGKCPKGSALTPPATRSSNLYRRLKRRLGCSLRRLHSKRYLVSARKQVAHKLLRTKSRVVSTKKIPTFSARKGRPDCHRQHHGCGIHQQGRRYEVRLTLCPSLAAPMLVQPQSNSTEGQTHSRPSECNCRQIVSPKAGHSDGVVPPSRDLRPPLSNLALSPSGHVCNKVQLQASSICVPNSRPKGLVSGCSDIILGGPGHVPLPPSVSDGEGGQQAVRSLVSQSNPDCPGMAQHALVLGPSGTICEGSSLSSTPPTSSDPTFQQGTSQGSDKPKSPCLALRAQTIKEQGFSSPVASRIEAPQRRSTRTVYEAKWAVFVRWCETSQVDFRNPSIKQIADFLLHLFQEKNLQPSTIDGYRSAIADKLGNTSVNVGKDENLTRLLDSFHRDRPKGRRGVPAWNLSLVLHQLTKAPFEPLRKASLKHLTFKTVFLLALASGKRRSEIHAWLNKNIRHQADWSKVSLYPSPSFLAKNHLAKEGPECVAPVVIPALAPTLDKSLKEDRSLCPVRALRYYLDKTQDLRTGKELVFVSFKQGFNKDISPATISSWIKQTVVLCYDLSDQDSLTLHQVKAHDVRAFAASKAFQGGISLDQILAACHWKSHNTFTQFYLKDVAWADKELFHLGPVVAAQQIHH